jgi:hypothetical protein
LLSEQRPINSTCQGNTQTTRKLPRPQNPKTPKPLICEY